MNQFVVHNWYLFAALVVVLSLLAAPYLRRLRYGIADIPTSRAVQLINRESAVLLDVREPNEFSTGHLPDALNIPVGHVHTRIGELAKFKDKPIIVYCRTGQRSAHAAVMLRKQGFASVHNLAGGVVAWQNENLPTER
jgi:rhodanese-related sulfurtransferase